MMVHLNVLLICFVVLFINCKCYDDIIDGFQLPKSKIKPYWNETLTATLRKALLTNYDKYSRPSQHYDTTIVSIMIELLHLETDELNSTLSVSSMLKLNWQDSKLKWDKDDYEGINLIRMADHEIWQPDLYLYNSAAGGESPVRYNNLYALVYSDGHVLFVPTAKLNALCEFDLYYWPFDTHVCYLKFVTLAYSEKEITFELVGSGSTELGKDTLKTSKWDVNVSAEIGTKYYDCCPDPFYNVQFNLTITRKSSSYVTIIITPIIAVVSLILILPWLSSKGPERIILSCCIGVMVTMLLIYFTDTIGVIGQRATWVASFYCTCLYLVCFAMVEAIFVMLFLKTKRTEPLPWNIKNHLKGTVGKFLLLEYHTPEHFTHNVNETTEELKDYQRPEFEDKTEENDVIIKSPIKAIIPEEWEMFTTAIDRILFLLYSFIFFLMFMFYLI